MAQALAVAVKVMVLLTVAPLAGDVKESVSGQITVTVVLPEAVAPRLSVRVRVTV